VTTKLTRAPIFSNFVRHATSIKRRVKWRDTQGNLEGQKYGKITYFPRYARLHGIVVLISFETIPLFMSYKNKIMYLPREEIWLWIINSFFVSKAWN